MSETTTAFLIGLGILLAIIYIIDSLLHRILRNIKKKEEAPITNSS